MTADTSDVMGPGWALSEYYYEITTVDIYSVVLLREHDSGHLQCSSTIARARQCRSTVYRQTRWAQDLSEYYCSRSSRSYSVDNNCTGAGRGRLH